MVYKPSPSRFPWQDLKALIMDPLLLDEGYPPFSGRTVSAAWHQTQQQRSAQWLERLAADPAPLQQWLKPGPSHHLGFYFEQLVAFWLNHLENIRAVQRHITVVQDGRTLGELDILCFDQDLNQAFHFELAIKYYLQTARGRVALRDFVGPKAQDRLDLKLERLFHKQLRLLETEAGRRALPEDWQNMPVTSQAFVKGGLFYPIEDWLLNPTPDVPPGIMSTAPRGWWVRIDPVPAESWVSLKAEKWSVLPRLEWMSQQFRRSQDPELLDPEKFWDLSHNRIQESGRPMLVIGYTHAENGAWREVTRGFLLPAHWPQGLD